MPSQSTQYLKALPRLSEQNRCAELLIAPTQWRRDRMEHHDQLARILEYVTAHWLYLTEARVRTLIDRCRRMRAKLCMGIRIPKHWTGVQFHEHFDKVQGWFGGTSPAVPVSTVLVDFEPKPMVVPANTAQDIAENQQAINRDMLISWLCKSTYGDHVPVVRYEHLAINPYAHDDCGGWGTNRRAEASSGFTGAACSWYHPAEPREEWDRLVHTAARVRGDRINELTVWATHSCSYLSAPSAGTPKMPGTKLYLPDYGADVDHYRAELLFGRNARVPLHGASDQNGRFAPLGKVKRVVLNWVLDRRLDGREDYLLAFLRGALGV